MYYNPARNSSIRPDLPLLPSAATHQSPFGPLPLPHLIFDPLILLSSLHRHSQLSLSLSLSLCCCPWISDSRRDRQPTPSAVNWLPDGTRWRRTRATAVALSATRYRPTSLHWTTETLYHYPVACPLVFGGCTGGKTRPGWWGNYQLACRSLVPASIRSTKKTKKKKKIYISHPTNF